MKEGRKKTRIRKDSIHVNTGRGGWRGKKQIMTNRRKPLQQQRVC